MSKLKGGKSDEETLVEILQSYKEEMEDDDDQDDVWFALADTMWKREDKKIKKNRGIDTTI